MNYEPVTTRNQTHGDAGTKTNVNAGQTGQEKASDHEYILLPLMLSNSLLSSTELDNLLVQQKEGDANSTNRDSIVSPSVSTAELNFTNTDDLLTDPLIPDLEDTGIFSGAYDDEDLGAKANLNNLETTMNVSHIFITRIHKDHPKDEIIGDVNSATQTRRMTKISEEHVMMIQTLTDLRWIEAMQEELLQFKLQKVWTLVDLPKGKRAIGTKRVYDEVFAHVARIEAISQDKYVADILKKFDFTTIKAASTLIETNKAANKDKEAKDVDVHLYRSMIGSLMYLTASRPDIMFVVCACARFQVTPKVSHLHAVKRIFRYLKGQPKLGLWYPIDSPFDLEAFFDSDYAGASLDRKSTTGGCQFLGKRLISWQCKKQTIVANSTTEAEYVTAANCYGQVLWI
ncbi:hypothetical protein Tco_0163034 [Tanacetum coccineum]